MSRIVYRPVQSSQPDEEGPLFDVDDVHSPHEAAQWKARNEKAFSFGRESEGACCRRMKSSLALIIAFCTIGVVALIVLLLIPSFSSHEAAKTHYDATPPDAAIEEAPKPTTFHPDLSDALHPPVDPALRVDVQRIPMLQVEVVPPLEKKPPGYKRTIRPGAATWAVLLHVNQLRPLRAMLDYLHTLSGVVKFDLFVTISHTMTYEENQHVRASLSSTYPGVEPALVDRGADVGGFLRYAAEILQEPSYEYVLKVHTAAWQQRAVSSLLGSAEQIRWLVGVLKQHPQQIGMIGDAEHVHVEALNEKPNYYYLHRLSSQLAQAYTAHRFIDGGMFIIRRSVLDDLLDGRDVSVLQRELNGVDDFDQFWYLHQYFSPSLQTLEQAQAHWETIGREHHWLRSGTYARSQNLAYDEYVPEGEMEHAWHRMLGMAVSNAGMVVAGVKADQILELPPAGETPKDGTLTQLDAKVAPIEHEEDPVEIAAEPAAAADALPPAEAVTP
jgi:hypothetical protein